MWAMLLVATSVCAHECSEWEMLTPLQESSRVIVLADVRLFAVKDANEARRNARLAYEQRNRFDDEVRTYNTPERYFRWRQECDDRACCWSSLASALDGWSVYWRLRSLHQLYDLIGHENFFAGRMPLPTPNYKILPNN